MVNVEAHELKLGSVIIELIGNFSEDDFKGEEGRRLLATSIKDALNAELEELEGFGGIEKVHFTSFVMQ
jgi:flagellar FliL protein